MVSCEDCTKGFILPGEPAGSILTEFDGAYFTTGIGPEGPAKRTIVLLTDIFGLPLVNCKLIADHLAKSLSCDVWVPDMFNGEPPLDSAAVGHILPDRAGVPFTFTNKLRIVGKLLPRIGARYRNRPSVVESRTLSFITKLRDEKKYEKVGAVGYCFGGMVAVRIGCTSAVDSIVVCHPGSITLEQIKAIKVPAAWACAEEDHSFSPQIRKQAEEVFSARQGEEDFVEYEFKDYKGTAHGFACRPNLDIPEVKEGYEKSQEQTVAWFQKTLPL